MSEKTTYVRYLHQAASLLLASLFLDMGATLVNLLFLLAILNIVTFLFYPSKLIDYILPYVLLIVAVFLPRIF